MVKRYSQHWMLSRQVQMDESSRRRQHSVLPVVCISSVSCPLACATHLRVIHHILAGLGGPYPFCFAYIDDILVFSDTLEEHITHLQQVFERLRSAVLLLHLKKCVCWHLSNILRSHNFTGWYSA